MRPCSLAPRPRSPTDNDTASASSYRLMKPLPLDEIRDQLEAMRMLESRYAFHKTDYQHGICGSNVSRTRTTEYLYQIIDFGDFQRHTVDYAMTNLLDRYLSAAGPKKAEEILRDRSRYQLLALTCLYMAVKLLEVRTIGVDSLVPLCNDMFVAQDFLAMEQTVLRTLDWKVGHGPTAWSFCQLYLQLLLPEESIISEQKDPITDMVLKQMMHHCQYQLELAVSDYGLAVASKCKPSKIALAAVWNALEGMDVSLFSLVDQNAYRNNLSNLILQIGQDCKSFDFEDKIRKIQERLAQVMWNAICHSQPKQQTNTATKKQQAVVTEEVYEHKQEPSLPSSRNSSPVTVTKGDISA
jgi:hypothetical protein